MTTRATDVETLVAAGAIRRLLAEYCHTCDDGRFASFAELFCADATFEVMGMVHARRDAIAGFMVQAQPPSVAASTLISRKR
ncbi:MAG: nuclear transport factor 2 family protein [Acidimicrobiales bacterium]